MLNGTKPRIDAWLERLTQRMPRALEMTNMPDWSPPSDDDETIEPHFNDTGDFGDHADEEDFEED